MANSTKIYNSSIIESGDQGFQGFVRQDLMTATSSTGTPAAGNFYSSITGRASMQDLSKNLRVQLGIERIMTELAFVIQNEFGPNGELVWGVPNDILGQIRFVGNISSGAQTYGQLVVGNTVGDFAEITFYGTGLNILTYPNGTSTDYRVSIDGGSEGSNVVIASQSTVLVPRNYSPNIVLNVASNLTLGIHTVKIRLAVLSNGLNIYGFEILNESIVLKVNPGTTYLSGKKQVLSVSQDHAITSGFETGTLGTRGGRVLMYQKSDGTIKKAVQPADSSQLNLTSANHANEEVVRSYYANELGAGRADDYSAAGGILRAFTLDDGTTHATSPTTTGVDHSATAKEIIRLNNSGAAFIRFTFVGTGLDIERQDTANGGSDTFNVTVDGTVVGNLSTTGSAVARREKIVSGLPYGTHVVSIGSVSNVTFALGVVRFIVYQPKKPTLPSSAVELADYNIMATYVANTSANVGFLATGVLRKHVNHEMTFVNGTGGTTDWTLNIDSARTSGNHAFTDRTNGYMEYTFFGTGLEARFESASNRPSSINVSLQSLSTGGSLSLATTGNFPSLVSSVYGTGVAFAAGVLDMNDAATTDGAGVSLSGLPLGLYKVRFNNNGTSTMEFECLDIITPIYSVKSNLYADLQNTLSVGSNAISDNRQITPVKNILPAVKAWAQATPITSNPTITATTSVPMPDMSVTIKTSGGAIQISYACEGANNQSTGAGQTTIQAYVDGVAVGLSRTQDTPNAASTVTFIGDSFIVPVSAGTHKVDLFWVTNAGTSTNFVRNLSVREL